MCVSACNDILVSLVIFFFLLSHHGAKLGKYKNRKECEYCECDCECQEG